MASMLSDISVINCIISCGRRCCRICYAPSQLGLQEKEQQDEDFARFQAKTERRADNADSVMSNYWRADEDLDEDERFLRDYVMNRQWLETDSL